jgi:hypothetical protein
MTKPLTEPTQLVIGIPHRRMLDMMSDAGIFCSTDKFARILQEAQRLALASGVNAVAAVQEDLAGYLIQEVPSGTD